jgi:DNA internalization-related competence protein ComEC/Rec2
VRSPKRTRSLWGWLAALLYGGFLFSFVSAAQIMEMENNLSILTLAINLLVVATGGLWLLNRGKSRTKLTPVVLVLLISAALLLPNYQVASERYPWLEFSFSDWTSTPQGDLAVHFIDVGQGDSILIIAPAKTVLIDGGTRGAGAGVVQYLKDKGIKKLDLVIATHPHEDHIGGLLTVLEAFPVGEVWDPGVPHTTQTFQRWLELIDQKEIPFAETRAGMSVDLGGGAKMAVLHPQNPSSSRLNDASIVTRLVFGKVSFLFTGDAAIPAEQEIIAFTSNLRSTVLKVGHHGSTTSSSPDFMDRINPTYAVISSGEGNRYFHPHQEVLDRLRNKGIKTFRTDLHGTIVMVSDGTSVRISTERQADNEDSFRAPPRR